MSRRLPGSAIVPGSITLTQITGSLNDTSNAAYAQANTARDQANNARSDANTTFATINTTFATLNTSAGTQNTNIGLAYDQANSARGQANTAYGQANSARDQANTARTTANDAYATANSRLPSVGGTLSGDLIITGNLTVSGNQTILNTEVLTTEDADIILLSNVAGTPALNAGLIVNRGTSTNTFIRWAENVDEWGWSDNGTVTYFFDDLRQGLITTNTTFGTINTNITNTNSNAVNAYASANLAYTQANNARSDANTTFATVNTTFATINTTTATMNTATSNRVLKAGDTMTGQLNISSGGLLVTGNVGIGDATVPYRLDVNGDIGIRGTNYLYMGHSSAGTNWAARLRNSGGQFQVDAGSFRIADVGYTGTITWLAGDTSGRVGIGTTSPTTRLHVYASGGGLELNPAANTTLEFIDRANTNATVNTLLYTRNGFFAFHTGGYTERLRILNDGNVGIGTTNPGARLQINASRTSSTNAIALLLSDDVTGIQTNGVWKSIRSISNGGSSISEIRFIETDGTNNNTGLGFVTATNASTLTERMRINNAGNVGIGTTNPGGRLHVEDGSLLVGDISGGSTSTPSGFRIQLDNSYAAGSTSTSYFPKIVMHEVSIWLGGFGISDSHVDYFSGSHHRWFTGTNPSTPTRGTERLKIWDSGFITTPSQPFAVVSRDSSLSTAGTIVFGTVFENVGNYYNAGTGAFTCPVAGVYLVSLMLMTNGDQTLDIELRVNGASSQRFVPYQAGTGGFYNQVSGMTLITCAANDALTFHLNSGSLYGQANGRHGCVVFRLLG